ncbi:hypothetical protein [uncultured Dokdonia sp.]|uniref:hypothetical protein n=1 Tax=uncultured Dokdonia sp. TaxID=575653 RepID=UPI002628013B|nr:hypothetical protein [uncultured Dokdonia sp.]
MSITADIERFYQEVPTISEDKKYWLIRTLSGSLHDTFVANSYVAIGYNEISLEAINSINTANAEFPDKIRNIKNLVIDTYKDEKKPGLIANQIYKFTYSVKKGDVVIIPSSNSEFISFGVVEQTPLLNVNFDRDDGCSFYRRKSIKWLKHLKRRELEPLLFRMFFSHNTVNDISRYGNLIESTLNNYFIKDDEEHVIFNIERNEDIGAVDLFQLGFYMLKLTETFYRENGLVFDINDFDVKVNLNSKGKLKFIKKVGSGAVILAIIAVAINGGGGNVSFKGFEIDITTDGLIQKVIDYQNNKFDREMVREIRDSMDSLQVVDPSDAVELYRQFSVNKKDGE